uniref:Uncharacterized protein n=1 Tax=Ditylenchus dipsaci TaxID=166011 RepID=A0A915CV76_9BILA
MTTNISLAIRSAALLTFCAALLGLVVQLIYLVNQYIEDRVVVSSIQSFVTFLPLPLIYICSILNGTGPVPLSNICRNRSGDAIHQQLLHYIPDCAYHLDQIDFFCQLHCKWTSNGFVAAVYKFQIELSYITNNSLSLVYLRSQIDPLINNSSTPLVGAAHMMVERDSFNLLRLTEQLKITHNEPVSLTAANRGVDQTEKSFEYCIWEQYSVLKRRNTPPNCTSEIYTDLFAETDQDFASVNYGVCKCALQRADLAIARCKNDIVFNRIEVESTINNYGGNNQDIPRWRPTPISKQSEIFIGELGGSLSIYIGFTVMSLVEAVAFFAVPQLRKDALLDEETMMERKNPPIKIFQPF